ncbi:hypothetical protein [Nostoc sp. CCY0012]|uniref:hypothetical protein n=1 Tax=Nostoc sp. CCY0012 TaxID=1056123 RepID=UPI0039C6456A
MNTAKTKRTTITQKLLSTVDSPIKQQHLNPYNSASSLSDISLENLDDTELDLEKIMFEELAKGLPSDIPMADF